MYCHRSWTKLESQKMWSSNQNGAKTDQKLKVPFYQDVSGFRIPGVFSAEAFKSALTYKPKPGDLFIVTFPKCGTTWVQHIVTCILKNGKSFESALEFFTKTPFLELIGAPAVESMKKPYSIKIHLPFHLAPWSPSAKYIFVARNPKDCCVSFYHHTVDTPGYYFQDGKFDDYFELFIEGKVDFGDYFDTLLSWYEHRKDPNVLFMTYEQLKKDTRTCILKIAEFIGPQYKDKLEKDEKILEEIILHSSFNFMKDHVSKLMAELGIMVANNPEMFANNQDIPSALRKVMLSGDFELSKKDAKKIDLVRKAMSSKPEKPKIPFYQDVDGFRIPGFFSAEAYKSALGYKPRPGDLFIVTYPKCGTTWVQNIIACIFRDGKPFQSALEFLTETPFLEMTGAQAAESMKRPGAIKFHLPYHMTPRSPDAKYIFVARNPKDCCVSFYHHTKGIPGYQFDEGEFDDFFELFINGEVDFGEYFDCVLSWYEHRNDQNILFITYEELKKDIKNNVLKISQFIGPQYKEKLEKDEKLLNDVILHSSFNFMKEHLNKHFKEMEKIPKEMILNNPDVPAGIRKLFASDFKMSKKDSQGVTFVRKGIVGDWRNHFSPMQNARLEKKFRERTTGTDLRDLWKDDM